MYTSGEWGGKTWMGLKPKKIKISTILGWCCLEKNSNGSEKNNKIKIFNVSVFVGKIQEQCWLKKIERH